MTLQHLRRRGSVFGRIWLYVRLPLTPDRSRCFRAGSTALIAILSLCCCTGVGRAVTVDPRWWVPNGPVSSIVVDGRTIYVGGSFSYVGPATGDLGAVDAATGAVRQPYLRVDGRVYSIVQDGSGGWYLGGGFTSVGGQSRHGLAHLDASGRLTAWDPNVGGSVFAVAVSGGTVYVGGEFTSIGGQARYSLGAVDASTGIPTGWNPNLTNGGVSALAVSVGTVYVGGYFTIIGGQSRRALAAVDAGTGLPTSWNPNPNGGISALAVDGGTIYVSGDFCTIGGRSRNNLAALDAASGAATAWDPNANSTVLALAVSGGTVYVGGDFTSVGGEDRRHIAALDAATGAATAWDPNADYPVLALAASGGTVYVGGDFSSIGGQPRSYVAALDASSGAATGWSPITNSHVLALGAGGGTVYVGGDFNSIGGVQRRGIAALDRATGVPTAWTANVPDFVTPLAVSEGKVYALGPGYVVKLDAASGFGAPWPVDGGVMTMAVGGGRVYIGGTFASIRGQPRRGIAALDTTGALTTWNPDAHGGTAPYVDALALGGGSVYAGGRFAVIGGQLRSGIAALDTATGAPTAWNPNPAAYLAPLMLALTVTGNTVYAAGTFTSIGGQARNNIAALDATSGAATAWNPNAGNSVNTSVSTMAIGRGTAFVSGTFTSIGGLPRNGLAAVDVASGAATEWAPSVNGSISALAASGGTVYLGGSFTRVEGQPQPYFAVILPDTVDADFAIVPAVLNPSSRGRWVTAYIEPVAPNVAAEIDVASIRVNGTVAVDPDASTAIGDQDRDGTPDLMVRLDRAALEQTLSVGDDVPVKVTGMVAGYPFAGTARVRVRRGGPSTAGLDPASSTPLALALRAATMQGRVEVVFALPDQAPARLEVADVSGRMVKTIEVGDMGAGLHSVDLGNGDGLRSGIYFLRLTQGMSQVLARALVLK